MYLREEKCLNFIFLLFVLVSRKEKGELGTKSWVSFPGTVLSWQRLFSWFLLSFLTHLDGKFFSSANEWTLVRVGKNILSHLKEGVKVNLSHLLLTVWKVTHGIATGESLSKRTNHSIFPSGVTHFLCPGIKPRKKMFLSLILIFSPGRSKRCWNTRQLNQWEGKCWCYWSDLPWEICCNTNAASSSACEVVDSAEISGTSPYWLFLLRLLKPKSQHPGPPGNRNQALADFATWNNNCLRGIFAPIVPCNLCTLVFPLFHRQM